MCLDGDRVRAGGEDSFFLSVSLYYLNCCNEHILLFLDSEFLKCHYIFNTSCFQFWPLVEL